MIAHAPVFHRRLVFFLCVVGTMVGLLWLAVLTLSPGGMEYLDIILLALFAITLPWYVIGFWNAVIGFAIMRLGPDPVDFVLPGARLAENDPITASTAIILCIRNELPDRAALHIETMMAGLAASGTGHRFHIYVLSDSDAPDIAAAEEKLFGHPQIGILQTLVIGMPSVSAFGRVFQFGMRLAMRSYTIGSTWWQGDCGPYWGHNAILRIAPFMACCQLPVLESGALVKGHVLSHDQIEAVLMRKAGYEVRILPEEGSSFEQNPPTLLEFVRRDLRWCQGNMQYWHFLGAPGLAAISRYQLGLALLMFIGSPAWIALLLVGTGASALSEHTLARPDAGLILVGIVLALWFAPNIATMIDVLSRRALRRGFGGAKKFAAGFLTNIAFVLLLAPIMWASHTLFFVRLLLGRTIEWKAQTRQDHRVPWRTALRMFWPHTLIGAVPLAILAATAPAGIPAAMLLAAGPLLSIPLAVATSSPWIGRVMVAAGLCRVPEERNPPAELIPLRLRAIELSRRIG
jgi:membrane glycosyltransferase